MKKHTLPLSLLIGATLTLPSLAVAAPADTAQANVQTAQADMQAAQATIQTAQAERQAATDAANDTMETEAVSSSAEQAADQSNPFVISETQTISRASVNSVNNNANVQQTMPTAMQAQQDMQLQVEPQEMQESEEAVLQEPDSQEDMIQEEQEAEMMSQ